MYLQFKHGFVEVDRWDGSAVPNQEHMDALKLASGAPEVNRPVAVIRSRERDTIKWITAQYRILTFADPAPVLRSPPGWDYEWRCYLSLGSWGQVMASIATDIDYRNFKAWTRGGGHSRDRRAWLAHAIWHGVYDAFLSGR